MMIIFLVRWVFSIANFKGTVLAALLNIIENHAL